MVFVLDNYDSFTYNLVQYLGEMGEKVEVRRNDQVTCEEIEQLNPDHILISPGPCTPQKAGISIDLIKHFAGKKPILGVCLGHQCIGQAFGGKVVRAPRLMHGKTSMVYHRDQPLFTAVPNPFEATRYHSLIVDEPDLPKDLKVTAFTDQGEIMAMRHVEHPVVGVQFHPESILTTYGPRILQNFLDMRL